MASVGVAPAGLREPSGHAVGVDKLPEEMNDMKIRDDKVCILFVLIFYLYPVFAFSRFFFLLSNVCPGC